jgi:mycothiol synthase
MKGAEMNKKVVRSQSPSGDVTVNIRLVRGADVAEVVRLWNRALVRDTISEGRFVRWLFLDADFDPITAAGCYVAEQKGAIVGFARGIIRTVPNDGLGLEETDGWIPVLFVAPEIQNLGIGSLLLEKLIAYFKEHQRTRIWVCGNTGSAPGYIFPGIDTEAYAPALKFFLNHGFVIDHEPVAMSRSIIDFSYDLYYADAWSAGTTEGITVEPLRPETMMPFFAFLKQHFAGDWNAAARAKLKSGPLDEVLIARLHGDIIGYCQWEGEHFGPFGVRADIRGKKIGAKLFVEAVRRIKAADGRSVWFNWADPDAARFYQRFGLEVTRKFSILRLDL